MAYQGKAGTYNSKLQILNGVLMFNCLLRVTKHNTLDVIFEDLTSSNMQNVY